MEQKKSQLKTGIVLNYVNMILGNLIPIFYTPIMLSLLGQSEYGLYKLSSSVTSYLSLISMGLGSAITRYLIKAHEEHGKEAEEKMFGLFCVIFNIIALAALLIGAVLTASLHHWYGASLNEPELHRMKILVFLMVINMALNFSQAPYLSAVTAHENFVFFQCMNVLQTCIAPMLNLVALFVGAGSIGMTIASMAMSIMTRIIYQIYVHKCMKLKLRLKGLPFQSIKEILGFSFWIFVANVVGQLYNATDTIMIGMVPALSTTGVAVYNVGITMSNIIGGISTGVSSLIAPKTNKMVFQGASGEELTDLAIRVGRIQGYIAALLITGFIAFGRPFLQLYAGDGYEDSYWVAICIAVPAIFHLVQSVCLAIIVAENKHRFRSIVYLFIAVLNVIGTWYLMKVFGVIGAAAMSGFATILGQGIIMNWYYSKRTTLNMRRFWKSVGQVFWVPSILCIITVIISRFVSFNDPIVLIIGIVAYSVIYVVLAWMTTLNSYEKELALGFIMRRKK
ncbi:MAG: oligosaccharide flippase family protein [Christensenellales bacterium]